MKIVRNEQVVDALPNDMNEEEFEVVEANYDECVKLFDRGYRMIGLADGRTVARRRVVALMVRTSVA